MNTFYRIFSPGSSKWFAGSVSAKQYEWTTKPDFAARFGDFYDARNIAASIEVPDARVETVARQEEQES